MFITTKAPKGIDDRTWGFWGRKTVAQGREGSQGSRRWGITGMGKGGINRM